MSKPIFFIFSLILMFQFSYTQNQENCNYGVIPYDDGGTYQGCRNYKGKANGEGKLTLPNVFIYIGMFKDGKFHGSGEFTYANGNKYVGSFENNMFSGQGTMTSNFDDQNHISEGFFSEVGVSSFFGSEVSFSVFAGSFLA